IEARDRGLVDIIQADVAGRSGNHRLFVEAKIRARGSRRRCGSRLLLMLVIERELEAGFAAAGCRGRRSFGMRSGCVRLGWKWFREIEIVVQVEREIARRGLDFGNAFDGKLFDILGAELP